jgi:surface protein
MKVKSSQQSWKSASSRCKTGIHQEVANNINISCQNYDTFQPAFYTSIYRFSILMYTGTVASFIYDDNETTFNQPCTYDYSSRYKDWYVIDASFINHYSNIPISSGFNIQLEDMLGSVPMGVTGCSSTTAAGINPKNLGTNDDTGMPIFGSIDISSGIVPSHTHDLSMVSTTTDTIVYDLSVSDISGVNLNNVCSSTSLSQNSTDKSVDNLETGVKSTNGYKTAGIFYIIYYPSDDSETEPIVSGYAFTTRTQLDTAVSEWYSDETTATSTYGDITTWDVSAIEDFSSLFNVTDDTDGTSNFNSNISSWDTSSATDMYGMFQNCSTFNMDISTLDTSNVADMGYMFLYTEAFNQDISSWDTSNVTDMQYMFQYAKAFNGDISSWDVSNVTNMQYMFYGETIGSSFDVDISSWDVSNVTDMERMFLGATEFNQDISTWDVSSVTNLRGMFYDASSFNGDISSWDVTNVTDMSYMFYQASSFNADISSWIVSNVTDMELMLYYAIAFDGDLSDWCVTNITYEPTGFSTGSSITNDPVWGTCP